MNGFLGTIGASFCVTPEAGAGTQCPNPPTPIPNSFIENSQNCTNTQNGESCEVSCNAGRTAFTGGSNYDFYCVDGTWYTRELCFLDCTGVATTISDPSIQTTDCGDTRSGYTCTVPCASGFGTSGGSVGNIICQNGLWFWFSASDQCVALPATTTTSTTTMTTTQPPTTTTRVQPPTTTTTPQPPTTTTTTTQPPTTTTTTTTTQSPSTTTTTTQSPTTATTTQKRGISPQTTQ
eukprot:598670_1